MFGTIGPASEYIVRFYFSFVYLIGMILQEKAADIRLLIAIVLFTILQLGFAEIPYLPIPFVLFLTILFAYLILLCGKDTLLRESHMYSSLSDKPTSVALKHDIKAHIQSFVKGTNFALYLASGLYFIFVALILSVVFRLGFAYQFSKIIGLDYFYMVVPMIDESAF
jgi:hypothetical protein